MYSTEVAISKNEVTSRDLMDRPPHRVFVSEIPEWPNISPVDHGDVFDASTATEVMADQFDASDAESGMRVSGPMLTYAGVRIDEYAQESFSIPGEYSPDGYFPFLSAELNGRRITMRAIPDVWATNDNLKTPFAVKGSEESDKLRVVLETDDGEEHLGDIGERLPHDSVSVLAYKRVRPDTEESITINPRQSCPIRCSFCFRDYDGLNAEGSSEPVRLVNLQPEEIASHVVEKFPDQDWASLKQIAVLSGAFNNYDALYEYLTRLVGALGQQTGGDFDPLANDEQGFHVLTHLIRTKEQMERARDVGVVSLEDTLEIIDQERRELIMPTASARTRNVTPKHVDTFDDFVSRVDDGVEVFGEERYSQALIIGLDDRDTTIDALGRLSAAGLKRLSYPTFQPYSFDSSKHSAMTAGDIMAARNIADMMFTREW